MPNLIEIQKNSYNWFLEEGLHEVFHDIAAIEDYTGNLVLEFVDYRLDKNPKYSIKECKERDATYAAPPVRHGPSVQQADRRGERAGRSSWATSRS